jgi:hypothetical protein
MGFVGTTRLLANIANLVTLVHPLSIRMINLLGAHSWSEVTLGDICRTVSDSAVWPKVLVVLLALGATRLYFSQSVPTAVRFSWPAPKVSYDACNKADIRKQNWNGKVE